MISLDLCVKVQMEELLLWDQRAVKAIYSASFAQKAVGRSSGPLQCNDRLILAINYGHVFPAHAPGSYEARVT